MKIKLITIIAIISIFSNTYAQLDNNIKAKLYFTEAQKLFEQGDFKNSLLYVDKAERAYGSMVARTLALKIKLEYNLGNFITAKKLFDTYTTYYMEGASKELNDEVLGLFVNIEEGAEAEITPLYIIVNGQKLEVSKKDLGKMDWYDAKLACRRLGEGWRLPTKYEIEQMQKQLFNSGKGNLIRCVHSTDIEWGYYWSSTEYDVETAYHFGFTDNGGGSFRCLKNLVNFVRPVRDI